MSKLFLLVCFLFAMFHQIMADKYHYCSEICAFEPEAPTYECGKKCGYKHFVKSDDTSYNNKWESRHGRNACFNKCCKDAIQDACTSTGVFSRAPNARRLRCN